MNNALYLVLIFIISPILFFINGLVIQQLWDWFIMGTFDTVNLNLPQAIGLSIIVGYMCNRTPKDDEDVSPRDKAIYFISMGLSRPLVSIVIGFVVSLFL